LSFSIASLEYRKFRELVVTATVYNLKQALKQ